MPYKALGGLIYLITEDDEDGNIDAIQSPTTTLLYWSWVGGTFAGCSREYLDAFKGVDQITLVKAAGSTHPDLGDVYRFGPTNLHLRVVAYLVYSDSVMFMQEGWRARIVLARIWFTKKVVHRFLGWAYRTGWCKALEGDYGLTSSEIVWFGKWTTRV